MSAFLLASGLLLAGCGHEQADGSAAPQKVHDYQHIEAQLWKAARALSASSGPSAPGPNNVTIRGNRALTLLHDDDNTAEVARYVPRLHAGVAHAWSGSGASTYESITYCRDSSRILRIHHDNSDYEEVLAMQNDSSCKRDHAISYDEWKYLLGDKTTH